MLDCPVCPRRNIEGDQCPQCGTDITPLLRLRELPDSYYLEGLRFVEQEKLDEAIEKLLTSISLNPHSVAPFLVMGDIYVKKGLFDEAIIQYDRALALEPGNEEIKKARDKAEGLKFEAIRTERQQIHKVNLLKKTVFAAPILAFLIGLSIIPVSTNFKRQPLGPQPFPVQPPSQAAVFHYTVKSADCLQLIAFRFYGDRQMWKKIYEANKNEMDNPNNLSVGQVIVIPIRD